MLVGFDDDDAHRSVTERLRRTVPPLFDFVTPMPYVALQQLLDEGNEWGFYAYDKGGYFDEITDDVIEVLTTVGPRKESPMSAWRSSTRWTARTPRCPTRRPPSAAGGRRATS